MKLHDVVRNVARSLARLEADADPSPEHHASRLRAFGYDLETLVARLKEEAESEASREAFALIERASELLLAALCDQRTYTLTPFDRDSPEVMPGDIPAEMASVALALLELPGLLERIEQEVARPDLSPAHYALLMKHLVRHRRLDSLVDALRDAARSPARALAALSLVSSCPLSRRPDLLAPLLSHRDGEIVAAAVEASGRCPGETAIAVLRGAPPHLDPDLIFGVARRHAHDHRDALEWLLPRATSCIADSKEARGFVIVMGRIDLLGTQLPVEIRARRASFSGFNERTNEALLRALERSPELVNQSAAAELLAWVGRWPGQEATRRLVAVLRCAAQRDETVAPMRDEAEAVAAAVAARSRGAR